VVNAFALSNRRPSAPRRASRIVGARINRDDGDRAWLDGSTRSFAEPLGEKIVLDRQLADLGVKLLDLARRRRFRVYADPRIERPRRMVQELLLPGVDLVRMNLMALRQIAYRRLVPSASSAIFAFSTASIFRLVFVICRSVLSHPEQTSSNYATGPKIRGHFILFPVHPADSRDVEVTWVW
jgi:hypothetical protein